MNARLICVIKKRTSGQGHKTARLYWIRLWKTYPNADQVPEAKELYEKLLYEQTTADKTYMAYKKYLDQYPAGAYKTEAKKTTKQR